MASAIGWDAIQKNSKGGWRMETRITSELIEEYVSKNYWLNKSLREYFLETVKAYPNRDAVADEYKVLNYQELHDLMENIISGLHALGVEARDPIAYQLPNWIEGHAIHNAIRVMDGICCPIVPIYREKELKFILNQTEAKVIFIPDVFRKHNYPEVIGNIYSSLPNLEHVVVLGDTAPKGMITFDEFLDRGKSYKSQKSLQEYKSNPNDVGLIMYTSGTTSEPKGVQHTDNTLIREYLLTIANFKLDQETIMLMPSPITHISGLTPLELSLLIGSKVVYMDIWDDTKAAKLISDQKCNFMISATPFLKWLVESDLTEKYDLSSMQKFVCGGAYIPPELIKKAPNAGIKAVRVYGSTECPTVSLGLLNDSTERAFYTDGKIPVGYDIKIVSLDGEILSEGQEGEIAVKGPEVFIGYKNTDLNRESFDHEGYFYTGDLGRIEEERYLVITGRKKDIIIRGGENISTKEVEDLLYEHPALDQVAIVAMPDPTLGEKACAYVKVKKDYEFTFDEMISYLSEKKIARQKLPERLEVLAELPTTTSGKIMKIELRKMIAEKLETNSLQM